MNSWVKFAALLLLTGCPSTQSDDIETDTDTDTDTNECEPDSNTEIFTDGIHGMVVDQDGNPVQCFRAQYCSDAGCTPGTTNGVGSFTIPTDGVGEQGAFEITPLTDTYAHLIPATIPTQVVPGGDKEFSVVAVTRTEFAEIEETPQMHSIGGGIHLDIGTSNVKFPPFTKDERISAVEVPVEDRLPVTGLDDKGGDVIAMWYMAPFDTHSLEGVRLEIEIENQWSLEAGKTYPVFEFQVDEKEYAWKPIGDFTLEGDRLVATNKDTMGLRYLTTLVLLEPKE